MIQVRRLWLGELPDVVELVIALMEEEHWPVTEGTRGAIALSLLAETDMPTFVAVDGETPVGMVQMRLASDAATGDRLELFRFYVKPGFRWKHLGHRLIAEAILSLPEGVELPVYCATVPAPLRRYYQRLGFETVSHTHRVPLSTIREALRR